MILDTQRQARTADFTFHVRGYDAEELKVVAFVGDEQISGIFEFRIELCCDDPDLPLGDLLGQPATLRIAAAAGPRFMSGIIRRIERVGEGRHLTYYAAEIVPVFWLLTKRHRSRIFQAHNCPDMTVPGIIRKVFADACIAHDRYRFALQSDYAAREYVVQYRECEFDFVCRLMEDEGIFYFFEHAADGHRMVIADSAVAHTAAPNTPAVAYREKMGTVTPEEQEFIFRLNDRRDIQTGAVSLDDFDFRKPPVDLLATVAGDELAALEYSDYPGKFREKTDGNRYAALRLEEFQCRRNAQQMSGSIRTLLPGFTFELHDHACESLNREYLVTRIRHQGSQPQSAERETDATRGLEYAAEIETIPAELPFRSRRVTPRPIVHGSQTALVVGPSAEEIYTDEYGRVKVQFHWDCEGRYDECSSCWIRVSQGMAGGGYGAMFLPRIGHEVVVDFLEGDPDRPLITGRVHNADQMPPHKLPDHKTRSCIKTHSTKGGGGTNEIRFEDCKGHEQLLLFAQRNLHFRSGNDRVENIGRDQYLTVNRDKIERVKECKHLDVVLDRIERVGGNQSLEVCGDVGEHFGNHSESVKGRYSLTVNGHAVFEAAGGITLRCGSNFITIDQSGIWLSGLEVGLNSGGAPLMSTGMPLREPVEPINASGAEPGCDVRYTGGGSDDPSDDPMPTDDPGCDDSNASERSWIEIEMIDELGKPWPHETYEVVEPDGDIRRGTLDAKGFARVAVEEPGMCEVRFPKLDQAAWRRANA